MHCKLFESTRFLSISRFSFYYFSQRCNNYTLKYLYIDRTSIEQTFHPWGFVYFSFSYCLRMSQDDVESVLNECQSGKELAGVRKRFEQIQKENVVHSKSDSSISIYSKRQTLVFIRSLYFETMNTFLSLPANVIAHPENFVIITIQVFEF